MGYMALLRNLRNFDEAEIAEDVVKHVKAVLADEDEVKRSRQFPFRFYSAFKATKRQPLGAGDLGRAAALAGQRAEPGWEHADPGRHVGLDVAVEPLGEGHDLQLRAGGAVRRRRWRCARSGPTLVQYGTTSHEVKVDRSKGVLEHMGVFQNLGGTQTMAAVREHFRPGEHTRVVIVTDEQAHYDRFGGGLDTLVPEDVHCYTWNLGGYRAAHAESGPTRHTLGGLTDQSFAHDPAHRDGGQ